MYPLLNLTIFSFIQRRRRQRRMDKFGIIEFCPTPPGRKLRVLGAHKTHPWIFDLSLIHNVLSSRYIFIIFFHSLIPALHTDPISQKAVTPVTPHCDKTSHVFQSKGMDVKKMHATERQEKKTYNITSCLLFLCHTRDGGNVTLQSNRHATDVLWDLYTYTRICETNFFLCPHRFHVNVQCEYVRFHRRYRGSITNILFFIWTVCQSRYDIIYVAPICYRIIRWTSFNFSLRYVKMHVSTQTTTAKITGPIIFERIMVTSHTECCQIMKIIIIIMVKKINEIFKYCYFEFISCVEYNVNSSDDFGLQRRV